MKKITIMTEKDLLIQFTSVKKKRDDLKGALKDAQAEYDTSESQLIEYLESNSAIATAKYEGLGYAQMQKPRLYASCQGDKMNMLFAFLQKVGREDLIKTTVMPQTLSTFVKERIENGDELPEFINYYLKTSIRLY